MTPPGRGRPSDGVDRRAAILDAARRRFAAEGIGASLRSIARDAGVDPSLVAHYFGDKERLLVATMDLPVDPTDLIAGVVAGGADGLAARVLTTFLGAWDPHADVMSTLIRSTVGGRQEHPPMLEILRGVMLTSVRGVLDGDDAELRSELFAAQLVGLATLRYVVRLEPLASTPAAEVVRLYAPAMQELLAPRR